jgi:Zn-dependent protease
MFLIEPEPTPYDLRFRLFGIDVRVHPFFWLIAALLGWPFFTEEEGGFAWLLIWIGCVFVSILIHEMGHVVAGRCFGSYGYIILYGMGGLAVGSSRLYKRWQRVVVYFAGPGAQFLLLGLVILAQRYLLPQVASRWWWENLTITLLMLWAINLFWPILNLLPIFPLDGGQISREMCVALSPQKGLAFSLGISGVLSGLLAVHCLMAHQGRPLIPWLDMIGGLWSMFLFAMFSITSFQLLHQVNSRNNWDDRMPWER